MNFGTSPVAMGTALRRAPMWVLFGLAALLWSAQSHADTPCGKAKDPKPPKTCYSLATRETGQPPKLALNNELVAQIYGDMPAKAAESGLRIDGSLLGVPPRVDLSRKQLVFPLARTADAANRSLWSRLLGSPFAHQVRELPVALELDGKALPFVSPANDAAASPRAAIRLVSFDASSMTLALTLSALVLLATAFMCARTTMIRDGSIPQLRICDRSFSLGRTQMAFWFCIVFASVVFIGVVTYDINSISAQTFVLIGVSAATALGSIAVDRSKDAPDNAVQRAQAAVAAMGITTAAQVYDLAEAVADNPNGPAGAVINGAAVGANAAPTVTELWNAYLAAIAPVRSEGLLRDLVNDVNGPTLHRWQILIWTLLLGGVYLVEVYLTLETPQFDSNLLALMGISSLTYIGFKIPERQAT